MKSRKIFCLSLGFLFFLILISQVNLASDNINSNTNNNITWEVSAEQRDNRSTKFEIIIANNSDKSIENFNLKVNSVMNNSYRKGSILVVKKYFQKENITLEAGQSINYSVIAFDGVEAISCEITGNNEQLAVFQKNSVHKINTEAETEETVAEEIKEPEEIQAQETQPITVNSEELTKTEQAQNKIENKIYTGSLTDSDGGIFSVNLDLRNSKAITGKVNELPVLTCNLSNKIINCIYHYKSRVALSSSGSKNEFSDRGSFVGEWNEENAEFTGSFLVIDSKNKKEIKGTWNAK